MVLCWFFAVLDAGTGGIGENNAEGQFTGAHASVTAHGSAPARRFRTANPAK